MGCLLALVAWISSRFALALVYLFTDRLTIAFPSGWAGIIRFLLLPYTTLFYALVLARSRVSAASVGSSWRRGCSLTCPRSDSAAAPGTSGRRRTADATRREPPYE